MKRGNSLILALALAALTGCASAGGAGAGGAETGAGARPQDNAHTRTAGVRLAQAATAEGEAAREHYEAALQAALSSIEEDPQNARGYLLAGQAAAGAGQWVQADTMFDRAVEIFPGYEEQVLAEREEAWVNAYNQGVEAVNAGDIERARDLFAAADRLYQQRPEARMNLGWAHMRLGDTEAAIEAYRGALEILYGPTPEGLGEEQAEQWRRDRQQAAFNAAQLLAQSGEYVDAAEVLGEFLERTPELDPAVELQAMTAQANFLAQGGRAEEAEALMAEIRTRPDLTSADYFQIGIGLFNAGDYQEAAEAFGRAAELNPYSRDALLNLVQSLYSEAVELEEQEPSAQRDERLRTIYSEMLEAAEQVREFDPLNRNLISFMLRAYRGQADLAPGAEAQRLRQRSQELFRTFQQQPYEVSEISLSLAEQNRATLTGVLTNHSGQQGAQVTLRFELVNREGQPIDSETVTVTAPAAGESVEFTTTLDTADDFAGWRYQVVQ